MNMVEPENKLHSIIDSGFLNDRTIISFNFAGSALELVKLRMDLASLSGVKILDLGCGSNNGEYVGRDIWPPALLLLAANEGAFGTGIDLFDFPESEGIYEHITANLIPYLSGEQKLEELLVSLPEENKPPYDVIVSTMFFDRLSPQLIAMLSVKTDDVRMYANKMRKNFLQQALELGRNGTLIVTSSEKYTIENNQMVEWS